MAENDVHLKDGTDVNSIMRDMMSIILEGTLDAEMEEELGYSKYDYRNKETENSRNGYSKKQCIRAMGTWTSKFQEIKKENFNHK